MSDFFYGVIEGFYGRQWSWAQRREFSHFLASHGFASYIYAPKGDSYLRGRWREAHPEALWQELLALSKHYKTTTVQWGLGLSPLGLAQRYDIVDQQALRDKVLQINQLSPDILCILFDDMRGDYADLAQRQLQIVADIMVHSNASQYIVCPTYYSFDPILPQLFGDIPDNYLEDLGAGLPANVGVFWTGNQVISTAYTVQDMQAISAILGRKPMLWDNYPANDGRLSSEHLHLMPYQQRPAQLAQLCQGHIVNPMNQLLLSRCVLPSLAAIYCQGDSYSPQEALADMLNQLDDKAFATQLQADISGFQNGSSFAQSEAARQALSVCYKSFEHPAADEIAAWLAGEYIFDPDCLTE
ncbi:MAG: hypothetical protein ACJAYG_000942 [Oceanicoccus sp.]|jgi:hyaluronoglucosaminidase